MGAGFILGAAGEYRDFTSMGRARFGGHGGLLFPPGLLQADFSTVVTAFAFTPAILTASHPVGGKCVYTINGAVVHKPDK